MANRLLLISGVICLSIASYGAHTIEWVDNTTAFILLVLLLLLYVGFEIENLRRCHHRLWLINPVVFCSIFIFLLIYGISNILFALPFNTLDVLGFGQEVTPAMVKHAFLTIAAALALWTGYWSSFAGKLSSPMLVSCFQSRFLPQVISLKSWVLPALLFVGILGKLLQIQFGIFGYSADPDALADAGSIQEYLFISSNLSRIGLVLAGFEFFKNKNKMFRNWLIAFLIIEVGSGFLGGFKGQTIVPLIIVAICQYIITGRFTRKWLIYIICVYFSAYVVVGQFRYLRDTENGFQGTSLTEIIDAYSRSIDFSASGREEDPPFLLQTAKRINLTWIGSFAIDYADREQIALDAPDFLENIILSPLHAFIPRLLWENKPIGDLGAWYNRTVLERTSFNSVGMGPVSYLYFAGSFYMVFIGFLFLGVAQRILFFLLSPSSSVSGAVVFLVIFNTLSLPDSSFNGTLVSLFRYLILSLIFVHAIFCRKSVMRRKA